MAIGFHDHKCISQFIVCIGSQNLLQLSMGGILCGWKHPKIEGTGTQGIDEHEAAESTISRDEHAVLPLGNYEQFAISRLRQTDLRSPNHIMS